MKVFSALNTRVYGHHTQLLYMGARYRIFVAESPRGPYMPKTHSVGTYGRSDFPPLSLRRGARRRISKEARTSPKA